ncbi:MAG: hypothetical protein M1115_05390 [Actinobacteria bacterium]|nr:hypothetical protein [Actinomycetota bacterium]
MLAAPLFRAAAVGWEGTPEEQGRLRMEAQLSANQVVKPGRLLVVAVATNSGFVDGRALLRAAVDDVLDHCSCALALMAVPGMVEDLGPHP